LFISFVYLVFRRAPRSTLFPYTTLFRSDQEETDRYWNALVGNGGQESACSWCKDRWGVSWQIAPRVLLEGIADPDPAVAQRIFQDRKSTRLNSSHVKISYAVFCLKKKKT